MKSLLFVVALMLTNSGTVLAADLPKDHNPRSDIWIDYSDLDYVLSKSVIDMGPSTHQRAGRIKTNSMTRMYSGSRTASRFEARRVAFHEYRDNHRAVIRAIRDDLLALPSELPLKDLSRTEQLVYWFNLHNVIVLAKIADEYPITNLEPLFDRSNPRSFLVSETFMLGDQPITLMDIQDHVLANWRDPLVIYGFYMGAVGTPDIRKEAFKSDRLNDQLRQNARDFVNSVRGTQIWDGELRVSTYYSRMADQFPDFEADVMRHLRQHARPSFARRLAEFESFDPRVDDWNIADLYNGQLHEAGLSVHTSSETAGGVTLAVKGLPSHVRHTLIGRELNFERSTLEGTVDIEEVAAGTSEAAEEKTPEEDKDDDPGELAIQ